MPVTMKTAAALAPATMWEATPLSTSIICQTNAASMNRWILELPLEQGWNAVARMSGREDESEAESESEGKGKRPMSKL